MKFILLKSRGGNYLVVAQNIAWLRTAENGQTNVGMIGGSPLLVVGSIEEVAATILAAAGEEGPPAADNPVASPSTPESEPEPEPTTEPVAPEPAPASATPEPARDSAAPTPIDEVATPKPAADSMAPEPATDRVTTAPPQDSPVQSAADKPAVQRPRPVTRNSSTLWERPAPAADLKVKSGTQRLMGAME